MRLLHARTILYNMECSHVFDQSKDARRMHDGRHRARSSSGPLMPSGVQALDTAGSRAQAGRLSTVAARREQRQSRRGLPFTEPDADNLADFHGDPVHPSLALYVGGNYFFAMAPLVQAFEARYPQYKGHVYWETIPPGLLVKQMASGGTVTVGNMTWTVPADVYLAGLKAVQKQIDAGFCRRPRYRT